MDMEKIIIRCNAEHLQYTFPKRKWYQLIRYNRIAMMRLTFDNKDVLETDIRLELYEDLEPGSFTILIDSDFKQSLYQAFLKHYEGAYRDIEHMVLVDDADIISPGLLYELAANRNYLSILTDNPQKYEEVLEQVEMDYGLVGMVFTTGKEFLKYLKQMPEKRRMMLIVGETAGDEAKGLKGQRIQKWKMSLLCCPPKESFLVDFSPNGIYKELIFKKRMKITYASIPIFLDNIVKNRYNAVVNEGITFQVKQDKKTVWRRKGNEDGRKEKYPDI